MSRSFRKSPFMSICGYHSAKKDKQLAHRGERRKHSFEIRMAIKEDRLEEYIPPIKRECSWNNVYSWVRDGNQRYCVPTQRDWQDYLKDEDTWPPTWYKMMFRK